MRVNSVTTETIDMRGRVVKFSTTLFKKGKKPKVGVGKCPFERVNKDIVEHLSEVPSQHRALVTVKTTQGLFKQHREM